MRLDGLTIQLERRARTRTAPWVAVCAFAGLLIAPLGCQRRAYNDLYIENMAAEIRDLEDQLYEYDYEYRMLEQELATLRAQNASLESHSQNYNTPTPAPSAPLEFFSPQRRKPSANSPEEIAPATESIVDPPSGSGSGGSSGELPSPSMRTPSNPSTENPFPSASPSGAGGSDDFQLDQLSPPTIDPGEPTPPPLPFQADNSSEGPGGPGALELNLSQVEIPAQLASRKRSVSEEEGISEGDDELSLGGAMLTPAVEQVRDTRVVEIAFHPTLSRAANFDDQTDDDGLYLVLQPKNESGQVVPIAADLTVVVLDLAREGDEATICRRDYSANEVKAKLRAGGTNQGIHLTMPWNGPDPKADRVMVFARYTFPDGRQVVGEKMIFVSSEGGLKTVWAPRGQQRDIDEDAIGRSDDAVRTASHFDATSSPSAASSHVVRPAVGTSTASNPPSPTFEASQRPK